MPVIVIGADTPTGVAVVDAVVPNAAETRIFISDASRIDEFKEKDAKVAIGDVSDASHVEAAAMRCFCAVFVIEAASDDRERSFASDPETVVSGWAEAVRGAGIRRVIWVGTSTDLAAVPATGGEVAHVTVGTDLSAVAAEVARLEEVATLPT